jgi:hypothetical protein
LASLTPDTSTAIPEDFRRLLYQGRSRSSEFYLHAERETWSEAKEWDAWLSAWKAAESDEERIKLRCRFPARFEVSRKVLPPTPLCSEVREWLERLQAQSVSLVYASQYSGNPASLFGHTFLRVNSRDRTRAFDQALWFAADGEPSWWMLDYAWNGIFGNYRGIFGSAPYFTKVLEYRTRESRDLWSYPLKLRAEEVELLLLHFWELRASAWFPYYFLDENCTGLLLEFLSAIRPDWALKPYRRGMVIPGEGVRELWRVGALESPALDPSGRRKLQALWEQANDQVQSEAQKLLQGGEPVGSSQALQLAIETLSVQKFSQSQEKEFGGQVQLEELLSRLSRIPRQEIVLFDRPNFQNRLSAPENYHLPAKVRLGAQYREGFSGGLGLRYGIHGVMDPWRGYSAGSEVTLGSVDLQVGERAGSPVRLQEFKLLSLQELWPLQASGSAGSWSFSLGGNRKGFRQSLQAELLLTYGVSTRLVGDSLTPEGEARALGYLLPGVRGRTFGGSSGDGVVRIGVVGEWQKDLRLLWEWMPGWRMTNSRFHRTDDVSLRIQWGLSERWVLEPEVVFQKAETEVVDRDFGRSRIESSVHLGWFF